MLEPIENQYTRIGTVNRSHGMHGEVLIISELYAPSLLDEVDRVHLQNTRGDLIPARIESVRTEEKQDRLSFFVKFGHVTDRNQADAIKGYPVYIEREIAERIVDVADSKEEYATFEVYDEEGHLFGRVNATIDNPAHPILQIDTEDGRRLLVPFVDEYVRTFDGDQKTIECHNLDQLEEL